MFYTKAQLRTMPNINNCESITCKYCPNETVVLQKHFVKSYVCPTCWSVPRLNKRKED